MKIQDVPKQAFNAEPTPIPMKSVPDWDALYSVLMDEAFIVLEADELRISKNGSQEAVNVKNFNNYVRITKRRQLLTKRISDTRWVCMLKPEKNNPYLFNPHEVQCALWAANYLMKKGYVPKQHEDSHRNAMLRLAGMHITNSDILKGENHGNK